VYHEKWHQVARDAALYHKTWKENSSQFTVFERYTNGRIECKDCGLESTELDSYVIGLLIRLAGDLRVLEDLDAVFASSNLCEHIAPSFTSWRRSIEENINNIPKFGNPACVTHRSFIVENV
jgi:hypothetical protein